MGMLVMDEYIDGWYIHKTKYDYADEILENYRKDLKDMVDKDYNHPSVIMYSTGNEVSETAQKKGISLTKSLTDRLHELDSTRPVSCGINIFFNFLSSMGFGVYSDKKADEAAENAKKKKAVGSEFYNTVAGIFGAGFMKTGATLYPCDVKTRDAYANMDVAGYNYGIKRYRHDLKKYPKRIILGSETFCADAYQFMQEAKRDKRIIGDFVWAAQDYLGEVGIGAWEYKDYAPRFDGGCGWVSAGSGRIDLTGKLLGEMAYTRVAFELEDLAIAVMPVNHTKDVHSPSAWKMTNAMESWSWDGCDGNAAKVEVYTRADHVKLYVNGDCVGTKKPKNDCLIESCKNSLERMYTCRDNLDFAIEHAHGTDTALAAKCEEARTKFKTAMDDDLNTPDALAAIFDLVKDINTLSDASDKATLETAAKTFDELTGVLGLLYNRKKTDAIPAEVTALVEERAAAKKAKDWGRADAIRAQLTEMGWSVTDTAQGPKIAKL